MSFTKNGKPYPETRLYLVSTVYFIFVCLISHLLELRPVAFCLISLPVFFIDRSVVTLINFYFLNTIILYDPNLTTSRVSAFLIPQVFLIFAVFLILFRRKNIFNVKIPITPLFLIMYLYISYCLFRALPTLQRYGFLDPYVLVDINDILMLLLAPLLFVYNKVTFKNYMQIILTVTLSSATYGLVIISSYLYLPTRKLTWNETFFADAVILSIILIQYLKDTKMKRILIVASIISFFAMIFTQTRSIWLSCMVCVAIFLIVKLIKNFKKFSKLILRLSLVIIIITGALGTFNSKVTNLITNRLDDFKPEEIIDPGSSMGYRIYESYMVIRNASWFGHGSGARLYVFDILGKKKWHYWESIHCEYFEILHKYGFIGLALFLLFLGFYFYKAVILTFHYNNTLNTIGLITLLIMLQHAIISITSGYMIRDNNVPLLAILITMVEIGWYRRALYKRIAMPGEKVFAIQGSEAYGTHDELSIPLK